MQNDSEEESSSLSLAFRAFHAVHFTFQSSFQAHYSTARIRWANRRLQGKRALEARSAPSKALGTMRSKTPLDLHEPEKNCSECGTIHQFAPAANPLATTDRQYIRFRQAAPSA